MEFQDKNDFDLAVEISDYESERGKPMPSKNHSKVQSRLSFLFNLKYEKVYDTFSELSLELSTGKADPDLAIFEAEKANWLDDEIKVTAAPLTAIEILSPTQGIESVKDKIFKIYFAAGVKSAWMVIPTFKTIHVITPDRQVTTFTSGKLTDPAIGVEFEMADIFP